MHSVSVTGSVPFFMLAFSTIAVKSVTSYVFSVFDVWSNLPKHIIQNAINPYPANVENMVSS